MRLVGIELWKLMTLRMTWVGVAVAVLFPPLVALSSAATVRSLLGQGIGAEELRAGLVDRGFGEMTVGLVGVVLIAAAAMGSELHRGRSAGAPAPELTTTLRVVPNRRRLLAAKVAAVAVVVTLVWLVAVFPTLWLSFSGLREWMAEPGWGDGGRMIGSLAYHHLVALLTLGAVTVSGRSLIVLVVFITNLTMVSFSHLLAFITPAARFLPDMAGQQMFLRHDPWDRELLSPVAGGLVMAGWAAVLLVGAGLVFDRRPA